MQHPDCCQQCLGQSVHHDVQSNTLYAHIVPCVAGEDDEWSPEESIEAIADSHEAARDRVITKALSQGATALAADCQARSSLWSPAHHPCGSHPVHGALLAYSMLSAAQARRMSGYVFT